AADGPSSVGSGSSSARAGAAGVGRAGSGGVWPRRSCQRVQAAGWTPGGGSSASLMAGSLLDLGSSPLTLPSDPNGAPPARGQKKCGAAEGTLGRTAG